MPGASQVLVPLYRILVDGQELDPVEADAVHQIKITDFLRLPDICTLQVGYPADDGPDPFKELDDSKFQVGAELEVKLGGTDDRVTKSLFKGEIVTVEPDFQAGGASMVVRAYDRSHRMMRSRKQRTFVNVKISDIVRRVCQENGLTRIGAGGAAARSRSWCRTASPTGTSSGAWRGASGSSSPSTTGRPSSSRPRRARRWSWPIRTTCTPSAPGSPRCSRWRPSTCAGSTPRPSGSSRAARPGREQVTEAGITRQQVRDKFPGAVIEIGGQAFKTQSEATTIAQATLDQLANAYLAAEGECDGNPLIKAGTRIQISGVGRKYSGVYRVAKAVHMLTAGGYVTQFSNSAGEHTLLGQSGGANGGAAAGRRDRRRHRDEQQGPRRAGPREGHAAGSVSEVETAWAPLLVPSAGKPARHA